MAIATLLSVIGNKKEKKMKHQIIKLFLLLLITVVFSGCQLKNEETENTETGELSIELTDAKGDFVSYTVDILALSLTKQNGSIVEVLPETTRIDFAQYVEMSEFLTLATIPSGIYTSATLHLDYQNSEIYVEDANELSRQVDSIIDENGDPVTTLESKVSLAEHNQLRIVSGVPAHLSLDFDLKTSNIVSFDDAEIPSVIVSPSLNASLEPELNKVHRVRGPLKNVDIENSSFDLIIRPFNHKISANHERFGNLSVLTNNDTSFEIDGETFTGTDGITAMDILDKLTAVIVVGDISLNPRRFMATEVYTGSSVPGGTMDVVKGTVLSRADNTLVVRGATLIRAGGSVLFNDNVNVLVDPATVVKRQNDDSAVSIGDISVGQAVTIFGTLNDDTSNLELDATAGTVRMTITNLHGSVVDSSTITDGDAEFELNLNKINGRQVALFDFSGTGIDTDHDANPEFYEISTGTLDTSNFLANSPVNVRGFVNGFGQAPDDFIAKSIIGMKTVRAGMQTDWKPFSNTAFSNISETAITLDFTDSGRFHHIGRRHERLDLTQLTTDFVLVPGEFEEGLYVMHLSGPKHVHSTFGNFANDLQDQINAGAVVKKIQAKGVFDIETGNFSAKSIRVHLQ